MLLIRQYRARARIVAFVGQKKRIEIWARKIK